MSLQVEMLEKGMAKLTIEVPADEFEKAVDKVYLKNKGRMNVQGFRKGKAPRHIIEKLYGAEIFFEDAANMIITEAYEKEALDCDVDIVSQPQIDVTQIEKGKPFIFKLTGQIDNKGNNKKYRVVIDDCTITSFKPIDASIEGTDPLKNVYSFEYDPSNVTIE